jgi:hypothetical protein
MRAASAAAATGNHSSGSTAVPVHFASGLTTRAVSSRSVRPAGLDASF